MNSTVQQHRKETVFRYWVVMSVTNTILRSKLKVNHWRSTKTTLKTFNSWETLDIHVETVIQNRSLASQCHATTGCGGKSTIWHLMLGNERQTVYTIPNLHFPLGDHYSDFWQPQQPSLISVSTDRSKVMSDVTLCIGYDCIYRLQIHENWSNCPIADVISAVWHYSSVWKN